MKKRDMAQGRKRKAEPICLDLKTVSEEGEFEGYGSVFGVKDSYDEIVAPGAFSESLKNHTAKGTLPALLWQHRSDAPLGMYTEMREDNRGLFVRGRLLHQEIEKAREVLALLKNKAIQGLSIGYRLQEYAYDKDEDVTTLTKLNLWEVSIVTFPANPESTVDSVKSSIDELETIKEVERYLRDEYDLTKSEAVAMIAKVKAFARRSESAANDKNGGSESTPDFKSVFKSAERLRAILQQ